MKKSKNNKINNDDSGMERCPLMGASKAVSMIDGAYMLVIGTEECTYYTKSTMGMKFGDEHIFSVVLDNHDVTFGSYEKVENAVNELLEDYSPKSLYLITTCVVEVIGDDFKSIAEEAAEKYDIEINVVKTSHFTGENEDDGMNKVFESSGKKPNKMGMFMNRMKGSNMDKSKMDNMSFKEKLQMKKQMGGRR